MKEMLKSKVMVLFIVMFLGLTVIGSNHATKMEENEEIVNKEIITLYIR